MPETAELVPTPAECWPVNEPKTLALPSGMIATVRRPNLYVLGRTGQVPAKAKAARARVQKAPKRPNMTSSELLAFTADVELFLEFILTRAFISPKVTMDRAPGSVCVEDVSSDDRSFLVEELKIEL